MLLYFDTNVFVRAVEGADSSQSRIIELMHHSRINGPVTICTSWLTLAETLVKPFKAFHDNQSDQSALKLITIYSALLDNRMAPSGRGQFVTIRAVEIDHGILWNAADVRAKSRLKLPDAIHLGTALSIGADVLVSDDRTLCSVAGKDMRVCSLDMKDLDVLLSQIASAP